MALKPLPPQDDSPEEKARYKQDLERRETDPELFNAKILHVAEDGGRFGLPQGMTLSEGERVWREGKINQLESHLPVQAKINKELGDKIAALNGGGRQPRP